MEPSCAADARLTLRLIFRVWFYRETISSTTSLLSRFAGIDSFVNNVHLWWSISADYRLLGSLLNFSFLREKSFNPTLTLLALWQRVKLRHRKLFHICVPQPEGRSCDPQGPCERSHSRAEPREADALRSEAKGKKGAPAHRVLAAAWTLRDYGLENHQPPTFWDL